MKKKKKKKLSALQKVLIIAGSLVLVAGLALGGVYLYLDSKLKAGNDVQIVEKATPEPVEMVQLATLDPSVPEETPEPEVEETEQPIWALSQINPDIINILLVGVDTRDENADMDYTDAASDSMMLVSCNLKTKRVCIFSLMRDGACYPWNKTKYDKINKAYSNDGMTGLINNVINGSRNFALDVQNYISINFYMFMHIIDAFGGIEIDLSEEECRFINKKIDLERDKGQFSYMPNKTGHVDVKNGTQILNGEQALWYARDRYSGGNADYGRTARQRNVLTTLYQKVKDEWTVAKMTDILNYVAENSKTNLSAAQMVQLCSIALSDDFTVQTTTIPFPGTGRNGANEAGQYMLVYDMKSTRERLHKIIYEGAEMPDTEETEYSGNPDDTRDEWD